MVEVVCVNCREKSYTMIDIPKYVCPVCLEAERIQIPSYFDNCRSDL